MQQHVHGIPAPDEIWQYICIAFFHAFTQEYSCLGTSVDTCIISVEERSRAYLGQNWFFIPISPLFSAYSSNTQHATIPTSAYLVLSWNLASILQNKSFFPAILFSYYIPIVFGLDNLRRFLKLHYFHTQTCAQ